jgi:hypothetical protein
MRHGLPTAAVAPCIVYVMLPQCPPALIQRPCLPSAPLPALHTRPRSRQRWPVGVPVGGPVNAVGACMRLVTRPAAVARRLGCPRLRAGCQASSGEWGLGVPKPLPRRSAPKVCRAASSRFSPKRLTLAAGAAQRAFFSPAHPRAVAVLAARPQRRALRCAQRPRPRPPPGAPTDKNPAGQAGRGV